MKTQTIPQPIVSASRIAILLVIFGIAFCGLMAEPLDDSNYWLEEIYASKALAVVGFYCYWKLYRRWSKTDKWIKAYDESCDEALDAPNPMYLGKEGE